MLVREALAVGQFAVVVEEHELIDVTRSGAVIHVHSKHSHDSDRVFEVFSPGPLSTATQSRFFGANRPGAKVSEGTLDSFWRQGMQGGIKSRLDCIREFSETDFTPDLEKFDVPTLILHGDDDQIVPIGASAMLSSKLVKRAQLKVYPGSSHDMCTINKEQVNADLLKFSNA